ncbi:MAG TPA: hypothetical protein VGV87_12950 [Blastocatellia bacterium]|jgi:hypothetical protein|nr:hypothetical protein [Blastocatellia bacterium]
MHCPNCGSNNHFESEVCTQCGWGPGTLGVGLADKGAVERWTQDLRAKYYSGRRNTIGGVLLLSGAGVVMLALMSKSLPPFLAFLWTCWIYLWGVIAFAEGASKWLSSRRQIKALAYTISQHPGGTKTAEGSDRAAERPEKEASSVPDAEGELGATQGQLRCR